MNLVAWLSIGALMGWVASAVVRTEPRQRLATNLVVGTVGAILGGWLITSLMDGTTINQTDSHVVGLIVSVGGAVALLMIANLVRRRSED